KRFVLDSSGRFAMTQQFAVPDPQFSTPEPLYVRLGDVFVILSATLLSLASGAWLIAQLGLDLSHTILAALGIYCALLVVHILVRRGLAADDAADTDAGESDVHWQTGAAAFEAALSRQEAQAERLSPAEEAPLARARDAGWPNPLPMPPMP